MEAQAPRVKRASPQPDAGAAVDLLLLSVVAVWGLNFAVMKQIYRTLHPLAFNALRFVLTSAAMLAVVKLRGGPLAVERRDLPEIFGLALVSHTVYQFLFALGLDWTRAGNSAILMSLSPLFAYVVGLSRGRERFRRRVLGGILLSAAGVAAVTLSGRARVGFGSTWPGDLMTLGAALCWGYYTGSAGRLVEKYGAVRLTVVVMLAGTAVLVPASLPWVARQDWRHIGAATWLGIAYASFLSIVYGYFAWTYALGRVGVSRTAVFSNVTPIVALAASWAVLGEQPIAAQLAGVILILTGVFLVRAERPSALPPEE